jgi:hypothetical protein
LVHQFWGVRNRDEAIAAEVGDLREGSDEASLVRRGRNFWIGLEFLIVWINGSDEGLGDC